MSSKEKILKELAEVNQELIMSQYNDGWWNKYMEKRKDILEKLLTQIEKDDNDNILDA